MIRLLPGTASGQAESYRGYTRPVSSEVRIACRNDFWTGDVRVVAGNSAVRPTRGLHHRQEQRQDRWAQRAAGDSHVRPTLDRNRCRNDFWTDRHRYCWRHTLPAGFRNRWGHTSSRLYTGCSWWNCRLRHSPPGRIFGSVTPPRGPWNQPRLPLKH